MMDRWLTVQEKTVELLRWEDTKQSDNRGRGGAGFVDAGIVPLCDYLNTLPGILTTQSCAGHLPSDTEGEYPGNLWLRLDKRMAILFDNSVYDLLRFRTCIESIDKLYRPWGEVISIFFHGNEKGQLKQSSGIIRRFFDDLVEKY